MQTPLGTKLFTLFFGSLVGRDQFANCYYQKKHSKRHQREQRWVVYSQDPDGSAVPPEWQLWLTHTSPKPPTTNQPLRKRWMIEHKPNQTGTGQAYRPPGAIERGRQRAPATGDYEPWTPD